MDLKNLTKAIALSVMLAANTAFAAPVAGPVGEAEFITDAFDAAISGAEVVFPYQANRLYTVYAQKGYITAIRMQPGESISSVSAGDTERWIIDKAGAGQGAAKVEHLYIKPVYSNIRTNMIINTTARTYQLYLVSGNYYNPVVTWQVADAGQAEHFRIAKDYAAINPEQLNFSYSFNKKELPWAPAKIFDDGVKTYIKMKPEVFSSVMPAFFVLDDKGNTVLVNYRINKGTYIIDRIFKKARLVAGKEAIVIKRTDE